MKTIEKGVRAVVHTQTTLHAAAEADELQLPFQIAIVQVAPGLRRTVRIEGPKVEIDDEVEAIDERNGVWYFRRST